MIQGQPSKTAYRVAQRRAVHQIVDSPRVFDDPVALKIIEPGVLGELPVNAPDDSAPGRSLRAFVAARSRYAEEQLALGVKQGVRQYVVLGAGLDTFAYRNPFPELRVFEVDFPATQAWKRHRLEAGGIHIPPSLTFAPVDFERDTLAHGLEVAGFKAGEPAFFSWLGVTPYLALATVRATLSWVISICPRNGIVFDYPVPRSFLNAAGQLAFDELASRVAAAGEPFITFFVPQELANDLHQMGYARLEDLDAQKINERYFDRRSDGLKVRGAMGRLMSAWG